MLSPLLQLSPPERSRVTSLSGSRKGAIALGYGSGQLLLLSHPRDTSPASVHAHEGGTLAIAFAEASIPGAGRSRGDKTNESRILSSGADGKVRLWPFTLSSPIFSHTLNHAGATTGPHGVVIDNLVADEQVWATAVARYVVLGNHKDFPEPQILGPLRHAVDDVCMLCDGTIAAATFGGVTLFCRETARASSGLQYVRMDRLPAAPPSCEVTLAFNGWVRSLCASPDGKWLAAHVAAAGREKPSLWLWRCSDGADFECRGLGTEIGAMCWSPASDLLATWAGNELNMWQFACGPPAGLAPLRLRLEDGLSIQTGTFNHSGEVFFCGTDAASVVCLLIRYMESTVPNGPKRVFLEEESRWQGAGVDTGIVVADDFVRHHVDALLAVHLDSHETRKESNSEGSDTDAIDSFAFVALSTGHVHALMVAELAGSESVRSPISDLKSTKRRKF